VKTLAVQTLPGTGADGGVGAVPAGDLIDPGVFEGVLAGLKGILINNYIPHLHRII